MKRMIILFLILIISCKAKESAVTTNVTNEKENDIIQNSCMITMSQGTYLIKDNSDNLVELFVGDTVSEDYTIKTEKGSFVELLIGSKSTIRVNELSILKVKKLFIEDDTEKTGLDLLAGAVLVDAEKLSKESEFNVSTETVTAGIRGTQFTVIDDGENTSVMVNEGSVKVNENVDLSSLDEIAETDPDKAEKIKNVVSVTITVNTGEKIALVNAETKNKSKDLNDKIKQIKEDDSKTDEIIEKIKKDNQSKKVEKITETEKKTYLSDYTFKQMRKAKEVSPKMTASISIVFENTNSTVEVFKNGNFLINANKSIDLLINKNQDHNFIFKAEGYEDENLTIKDIPNNRNTYKINFQKKSSHRDTNKKIDNTSKQKKSQETELKSQTKKEEKDTNIDDLLYEEEKKKDVSIDDLIYEENKNDVSIDDLYYEDE